MTPPSPLISPDGAYWWDGQNWQPMPMPSAPAPVESPPPLASRPAWLPEGSDLPGTPAAIPPEPMGEPASPTSALPPPVWHPRTPPSSGTRTLVVIVAIGALALIVVGGGVWAVYQFARQSSTVATGNPAASPSPSLQPTPSPSPSPSPAAVQPLTAQLGGDYCPVAHRGDSACWKGSFINTGPPVGNLAMTFIIGSPYTNWFASHANGTLSGFYTSAGCQLDVPHAQIVCGTVPPGGEVDVYLGGDVSARGTFIYAVKFADISRGSPVYVDQHADGTHDIVSWTERIT